MAWLHGQMLDMHGNVIPGIHVKVSSSNRECEVESDREGKFNCQLPAGRYEVTEQGTNILPDRRPSVTLLALQHKYLILRPVFVAPSDQIGVPNAQLKYAAIKSADKDIEAMVRFETSAVANGTTTFRGGHVMLATDVVTIYANEITCSESNRVCSGTGTVKIDIGKEQLEGTSVVLNFSNRKLVLSGSPTVMRTF